MYHVDIHILVMQHHLSHTEVCGFSLRSVFKNKKIKNATKTNKADKQKAKMCHLISPPVLLFCGLSSGLKRLVRERTKIWRFGSV